jgi:hypothetical protein
LDIEIDAIDAMLPGRVRVTNNTIHSAMKTMNNVIRPRLLLAAQFGILFAQLLGLGFALVGEANDLTGATAQADYIVPVDSQAS